MADRMCGVLWPWVDADPNPNPNPNPTADTDSDPDSYPNPHPNPNPNRDPNRALASLQVYHQTPAVDNDAVRTWLVVVGIPIVVICM